MSATCPLYPCRDVAVPRTVALAKAQSRCAIARCAGAGAERPVASREDTTRSHISSCKRFAAWLKRSPDTATPDEVRRFQLYLIESGASICNRNRIMTGVRFLFRVTLRRHDLAAEVWHIKEPQKLPPVLSPEEVKRVLTMATSLKARAMLTLAYGCGLRAGEVVRLRAGDIDSEQMIIRIVQSKGRKDRHVMLPAEVLDLLRQWWKARPTEYRRRRRAGTTLAVSRSQ